jgi:hypothetical protein
LQNSKIGSKPIQKPQIDVFVIPSSSLLICMMRYPQRVVDLLRSVGEANQESSELVGWLLICFSEASEQPTRLVGCSFASDKHVVSRSGGLLNHQKLQIVAICCQNELLRGC